MLGTLAAAAGLLVLGAAVAVHLASPASQVRRGLAEARAFEQIAQEGAALHRYRSLVLAHHGQADVGEAVAAYARLAAAQITCAPGALPANRRTVESWTQIPPEPRAAADPEIVRRLAGCADELQGQDVAGARAALAVQELAARVAGRPGQADLDRRRRTLAARLEGERPLEALRVYLQLGDPTARAAAGRLLAALGPAVWVDEAPLVESWMAGLATGEKQVALDALAAARAHVASHAAVLRGPLPALARALDADPRCDTLAAEKAVRLRLDGEPAACLETLAGVPHGARTVRAREVLGHCLSDAGEVARAEEVLQALVDERLPEFQAAGRAYAQALAAAERRLDAALDRDELPAPLLAVLQGQADEKVKKDALDAWWDQEIRNDPGLQREGASLARLRPVVGASLVLATLQLRRAPEEPEPARSALLGSAERLFLAIRDDADGSPDFHLGLGQVQYRLGRAAEGDAEFERLLASADPGQHLAVARAYRELGLEGHTARIARALFEARDTPSGWKQEAAFLLSRLATSPEDEERWLRRANPGSREVRTQLDEIEAGRLLESGRLEEADRLLARVLAARDEEAAQSAAAANNAGLVSQSRYAATGERRYLEGALERLERAAALSPDNAVILGNLAATLDQAALADVLGTLLRTGALRPEPAQASSLADSLLRGRFAGELRSSLAAHPWLRRSRELTVQEIALAPRKPAPWERVATWLRRAPGADLAALCVRAPAIPSEVHADLGEAEPAASDAGASAAGEGAAVTRAAATVRRTRAAGHAPTLAAALMLQGDVLEAKGDEAAAASAFRAASQAWPDAGFESDLARVLVGQAVAAARRRVPAEAPAWAALEDELGRLHGLDEALRRPALSAFTAALRAEPSLQEAARLLHAPVERSPQVADWIVARAAGDLELQRRVAARLRDPALAARFELSRRLYPGDERGARQLRLLAEATR